MLPEGWKLTQLKNIANVTSSKRIFAHDYVKSGIPFYRSKEIILKSENKNINNEIFISRRKYIELKDKFGAPQENEILISSVGTIGKIYLVRKNDEFYFKDGNLLWIKDLNNIYPAFLAISMKGDKFQKKINDTTGGSSQRALTIEKLEQLYFLLPPLPEQKKIAAILSTWDRAIEGTEKLLANSQQQKKALMQQLLTGKKRLPGFTAEWRICSLSDVATIQTATSKTQYICENGERFIVDMGSINRLGNLVCTKSTQHNTDLLSKGTLVMPKDDIGGGNIIGRTSYIDRDDLYVLGDHVYALHTNDCDSKFLHFIINSYSINKNLRRRANGTAQLGLGKKDVLRQKIKIPSELPEQKAIATVLTTADEEITTLESDLTRLRQEKKALMQQLLTGKRRVTVD